ncbi:hypothetical protein [Streptomyces sp. NPDC048669]|uniref:hypothetical protein n=1 Tax=Streptomyces sp. NPDC048669 TaxID=3155267 RepID=UPI00343F621C
MKATSIRRTSGGLSLHTDITRAATPNDGTVSNPSRRSKGSSMSVHSTSDPSPEPDPGSEPDLDPDVSRHLLEIKSELVKLRRQRRLAQAARTISLLAAAREAFHGSDSDVWAMVARSARQVAKLFEWYDK